MRWICRLFDKAVILAMAYGALVMCLQKELNLFHVLEVAHRRIELLFQE
jgi:hypothetical protein